MRICSEENIKFYDYDSSRIRKVYNIGDNTIAKNFVSPPKVCRKIISRFNGPYKVIKTLPNDRYML